MKKSSFNLIFSVVLLLSTVSGLPLSKAMRAAHQCNSLNDCKPYCEGFATCVNNECACVKHKYSAVSSESVVGKMKMMIPSSSDNSGECKTDHDCPCPPGVCYACLCLSGVCYCVF